MIQDILFKAQQLIGSHWEYEQSRAQQEALLLARDVLHFIAAGQSYRFEDYREKCAVDQPYAPSEWPATSALWQQAEQLFIQLWLSARATEEAALAAVIIDALRFIDSTSQREAFEEYQRHIASDAPPWVVAYFKTRGEADIWLEGHPQPPDGTHVLVGDEYYRVIYLRDMDSRRLLRDYVLERYIDSAMQEGVPAPVAAFATSADAEKWLASQSDPPGRAFISVAGEHCLAVYHSNIKHRAIYPVSIVKRWRGEG